MPDLAAPPAISISGSLVALGPLRRDHLPRLHRGMNDFATMRTQGDLPGPRALDRVERWFGRVVAATDMAWFTIYALPHLEPIGITWLAGIDYYHGTAGFGISIDVPEARGRGYGTEATRLMLDFAFDRLGLHNVLLEVYSNNPAGVRAYTRAGFVEIGRRRECYLAGGQWWDEIFMECVRDR